jgi:predicted RNA-binding Zn-ribbon protein involved in translation (DUF1610 family)
MMAILYTSSTTTIDDLVQKFGAPMGMMREGAFRKRGEYCPHCEHKMPIFDDGWLREKHVREIALIVDLSFGPIVRPEETAVVICECPKCGKKNIYHYPLRMLEEQEFIDSDKIRAEMERRKLTEKKEKTDMEKELEETTQEARLMQRVSEMQASLNLDMLDDDVPNDIPDFKLPCGGRKMILDDDEKFKEWKKCTVVWTKENTNPVWRTPHHLVARCPECGHQRSITKELEEAGYL